jgi:hypothetical protein
MVVCLYSCLRYPAYKTHLSCAEIYFHLRPACVNLQYFHTSSHKRQDIRKKKFIEKKMVLIFSTAFSEKLLILNKNQTETIKQVNRS